MDPSVQAALIGSVGTVLAAILGFMAVVVVHSHRTMKDIKSDTEKVGNGFTEEVFQAFAHVNGKVDAVNGKVDTMKSEMSELKDTVSKHLEDTDLARKEGIQLWKTVETVARATPPPPEESTN